VLESSKEGSGISAYVAFHVEEKWIRELLSFERLDSLTGSFEYEWFDLKMGLDILKKFIKPDDPEMITLNEKKARFDPDLENCLLRVLVPTFYKAQDIKKRVEKIVQSYYIKYCIESLETQYMSSSVVVIGAGLRIQDVLLENEYRTFEFPLDPDEEYQEIEKAIEDLEIDDVRFSHNDTQRICVITAKRSKDVQKIIKILRKEDVYYFLEPTGRSCNLGLSLLSFTWYTGVSKRNGRRRTKGV